MPLLLSQRISGLRLLVAAVLASGGQIPAKNTRRVSGAVSEALPLNGPKSKSEAESPVLMGPLVKSGLPPKASEPNPKLEAALDRLLQGIRQSRGG
jgi:hypothetical protein